MQGAATAPGVGSQGWYRSEQEQQQQQPQKSKPGSPLGRRSGSPARREQQQGVGGGLQRPLSAAAAGNGDSLTAALSSYGRQVGGPAVVFGVLMLLNPEPSTQPWVFGVVEGSCVGQQCQPQLVSDPQPQPSNLSLGMCLPHLCCCRLAWCLVTAWTPPTCCSGAAPCARLSGSSGWWCSQVGWSSGHA